MNNWIKKDLKYNWHPYSQMKDCEKFPPILIERARGIKLYDSKGKFYYDAISSWWCNLHGHNHPLIKKAIKKQADSLEHILFAGFTHKPAIRLAEELLALAPKNLKRIFYSDNGSTAVEIALKISFQYWKNQGIKGKNKFVSLDMGYHGDTVGTMSVSGVDLFNQTFSPLFFKSYKVPTPYCYRCPFKKNPETCDIYCINALEKLLKTKSKEISALILEPLLIGAGGMIVYPKEYLVKAAKLAKKYNIHLILDEVATGFGRTGKMFACQHTNVKPDLICISKGITAGYMPMAGTLVTDKIFQGFSGDYLEKKTFFHGHTYTANPLASAAGIASLEIFRKEKTLTRINKLIPKFHRALEEFRSFSLVGDVRYIGLVGALELVKNKKTKEGFSFKERFGYKFAQLALKHNLVLRPLGNIIYLFLPLSIKESELEDILRRLKLTILEIASSLRSSQ